MELIDFSATFFLAIASGKLITWGSTDEENQIYMTCGKHGVSK